jgi:hypothetical protein
VVTQCSIKDFASFDESAKRPGKRFESRAALPKQACVQCGKRSAAL